MPDRKSSKTASSDLFNRYIWLANTVYSAGSITFAEIAAKWLQSRWNSDGSELPLRTFHDHRKAVEEMFDINIECDRRNGFRYHIENAGDLDKGKLRKWLLGSMAVNNLLSEGRSLHKRILLEEIPSGINMLSTFIEAMKDGRRIRAHHKSFHKSEEYDFVLEPYCTKLFHQRWYVLGRNVEKDSLRVYALDRLSEVGILPENFSLPEDFDGEEYFCDYFGVWADSDVELQTVRIKIFGASCDYTRSLPLHHSQKEILSGQGWAVFEYRIRPTKDFINELAGMSEYSCVLEPLWIKEDIRERIRAASALYE